jgi:hypothetical protein
VPAEAPGPPLGLPPAPFRKPGKPAELPPPQMAFPDHVYQFHIEGVLDHIDDYDYWLHRFRVWAPSLYELTSRFGCLLLPRYRDHSDDDEKEELHPWLPVMDERVPRDPRKWPSLLLASFDQGWDSKKIVTAKLVVMQRVKNLADCASWGCVSYACVMFWSQRGKKREDYPFGFYIGVSEAGEIKPLPMICTHRQTVRHHDRESATSTVHHRKMDLPQPLFALARHRGLNVQEWTQSLLVSAINEQFLAEASGAVQVNIRARGAGSERFCHFSIPVDRTGVFFKDRDLTVNQRGKVARIFHHVDAHDRTLRSGKTIPVSEHYRGLRKFTWKGHQVCITVADHHHGALSGMDIDAIDFNLKRPTEPTLTNRQFAREMTRYVWESGARVDHGEVIREHFDLHVPRERREGSSGSFRGRESSGTGRESRPDG